LSLLVVVPRLPPNSSLVSLIVSWHPYHPISRMQNMLFNQCLILRYRPFAVTSKSAYRKRFSFFMSWNWNIFAEHFRTRWVQIRKLPAS
jgi:hypothetical protein